MKWLSTSLAVIALAAATHADVTLGAFTISSAHGNVQAAHRKGQAILAPSFDQYILQREGPAVTSDEQADQVTAQRREGGNIVFECRNVPAGISVTKAYRLTADEALAKTVTVQPLASKGELHVYSVVTLDPAFRQQALYYSPRQSWPSAPERDLSGVRPARTFTQPVVSGSGWDNRLAVGFLPQGGGIGHCRYAVNGRHVMPSSFTGVYGGADKHGLTYTPQGWHFEAFHMLEGDRQPVSATMHYALTAGDYLDIWREFRSQPEQKAQENLPVRPWCQQVKVGSFWQLDPDTTPEQREQAQQVAKKLGGTCLPLGLFAWCLDGDYDTTGVFVNEPGNLAMSADWMKRNVADLQSDGRVRIGMYIQGCLIDSVTKAFAAHPEWTLGGDDGKPLFSGFRDNPIGYMYFFNPLNDAWVEHYLKRLKAMCDVYQPGWIYCDGGAPLENTDFRSRRATLPDVWDRLYQRQYDITHASGPDRAVLLNAQDFPYADMYWLECGFFSADTPWRQTIEFCLDTEVLHTPQRAMLPLYWADEDRYLAMCVACGFTPCTSGRVSQISAKGWRAIDVASAMRPGEMILSSQVVSPVWWRDDTTTVAFAERVGDLLAVPVLNFGTTDDVQVSVNTRAAGMKLGDKVWLVNPFATGRDEDLGARPKGDMATFRLKVPPGFGGLRLLVIGGHKLV